MDNDNRLVLTPGDLFVRDGITYRYLGNGLAEPLETMTKRFDMTDARPLGGSHAAIAEPL
jgi:hypothetical protein